MGFSKKDLGDVVWSSETSRDPVFLTSRPKDIDYPQLLRRPRTKCRNCRPSQRAHDRSSFVHGGSNHRCLVSTSLSQPSTATPDAGVPTTFD